MGYKLSFRPAIGIAFILIFICATGFLSRGLDISPFPATREFEVTYAGSLSDLPADARRIRVWVPLAGTRDGQEILERQIAVPGGYEITRDPVYGNEILYFELSPPFSKSLEFAIVYHARVAKESFYRGTEETGLERYLLPSRLMVVNQTIQRFSREAVRKRQAPREKARGIYDFVIEHLIYDKETPGWGRGDTLRVCQVGRGNCTDFHSLFISMAQASRIPARFKIGFTVPDQEAGEIPGYHCWAEFYEEGKGWRPVDASEAWKHPERKEVYFGNFDTNKFLVSVGRDIELRPRQEGDPVNIFFYPYVEVDGRGFDGVQTRFQFKSLRRNDEF